MKNLSFKRSIFFAVCFSFLAISFNSGCETTDYEPLIMKKKLQEMEKEISELKAAVKGAAVAPDASATPAAPEPPASEDKASDVSATAPNSESGVLRVDMNPPANEMALSGESKVMGNLASGASAAKQKVPKVLGFNEDIERASATISSEALLSSIKSAGGYVENGDDGSIKRIDLSETSDFKSLLPRLASVPTLSHLSLNGPATDSETFQKLAFFKNLKRLDIERSAPTADDMQQLKKLPALTFISLGRASVSDEAMKVISEFPALQQIRCSQTRISLSLIHI